MGIGEHPASDSLALGGLASLHSLSYLWVSGRRRLSVFGLATPATSRAVVALYILSGNASGVTFTSTLTLTLALVNA